MNRYIFENIKNVKKSLLVLGGLSVIASASGMILPYYNGVFVDTLIYTQDFNIIIKLTLIIISFGVIDVVFNYFYNITYIKVLNSLTYRAKMKIVEHLRRVSIIRIGELSPAYLNQRISIDVTAVFQFFVENYITCFLMIIVIFIEGYVVFKSNVLIGGLVVLFIPVYVFLYMILKKPLYEKSVSNKEEQNTFFHKFNDQISLMQYIKINADFDRNNKNMDKGFQKFLKTTIDYNKVLFWFSSCDKTSSLLFHSIMYLISGYEIINRNLSIGEFTMINAYFSLMLTQIRYFFNLGKKYQDAKSSYDRIHELMKIPKEKNGNANVDRIDDITLKNVCFRYGEKFPLLIEQINYQFKKGNVYCISGANGAGKSTLLNIIIGIINESVGGEIWYGHLKLQEIDMYETRKKHISVMNQEFDPGFDTTVSELLCTDYSGQGWEQIKRDLKKIVNNNDMDYMFDKKLSLDEIWNRRVKDLSGGEKQKVNLIWCVLKNTDVLIMDEPTASMDRESVEVLKRIIKVLAREKIIIIVTHDKGILEECNNQILLIDNKIDCEIT